MSGLNDQIFLMIEVHSKRRKLTRIQLGNNQNEKVVDDPNYNQGCAFLFHDWY